MSFCASRSVLQVLLHHVLVEACHDYHDEDATEELLPKILSRACIVEHEDAAHWAVGNGAHCLAKGKSKLGCHIIYNKEKGCEKASGLEGVGPNECLYSASSSVEPNQRHHSDNRYAERQTNGVEHETLQNDAHHIEAHRRTSHFR